MGPERLPAGVSAMRGLRDPRMVSTDRRDQDRADHDRFRAASRRAPVVAFAALARPTTGGHAQDAGPVIVVETSDGAFAFETYPERSAENRRAHPRTGHGKAFTTASDFHRAIPGFVVQWGDPQSRRSREAGRLGPWRSASSGKPIGVPEISRKRLHDQGRCRPWRTWAIPRRPTARST